MIRRIGWTIILATACTLARAAEPGFRYTRPIELPTLEAEELLAATFDSDVYSATRDGFPDLRTHAAAGDVAYVIRKATTTRSETVRNYYSARDPQVHPLDNDSLEIIVHLGDNDPQPQGVRIVTPLRNFEQRVRISSSADGKDWQQLGEDAVLFDYSQFMDARSDNFALPATTNRYFRIVIDNVTQELESQLMELTRRLRGDTEAHRDERLVIERRPFRIDRIEFWHDAVQEHFTGDLKVSYPVGGFQVETNPEDQQTTIHVDSRREPLTSLKLVTSSHNFSRHAQVQVERSRGVERTWQSIGDANLSRLDFRNLKREDLTITFPESRETAYRIVIENRGSPPLEVTGVEAQGDQYQAIFLSSATDRPLELLYGSQSAQPPDYDTAAITASLAADYQPVAVTLGKQVEHPGGGESPPLATSRLINDPRILGGIAVILVAALAWGLFHAGRRLDGLPRDES